MVQIGETSIYAEFGNLEILGFGDIGNSDWGLEVGISIQQSEMVNGDFVKMSEHSLSNRTDTSELRTY